MIVIGIVIIVLQLITIYMIYQDRIKEFDSITAKLKSSSDALKESIKTNTTSWT